MTYSKNENFRQYFPLSPESLSWGLSVTTLGHQYALPGGEYPVGNHPFGYTYNPNEGRILNDFQLVYIPNGSGFFESTYFPRKDIHSGALFFLFPGEWHNYRPHPEIGWEEYWVGCKGSIISTLCMNGFFRKNLPVLNIGLDPELIKLFESAIETTKKQDLGFQFKLAGIVTNIFGYCNYLERIKTVRNNELAISINKAKELISENVNLKPEELAEKTGMGYTWFRRVFKDYTGLSPAQYISDIKYQQSIRLLTETTKSIPEISQLLGFESDYYFTVFFKKQSGQTPIKYRNSMAKKV